jgi:TRAP-type mannitol/chloroaromatic compound transport system permease small subunit
LGLDQFTVKGRVFVAPIGVVTPIFLIPAVAVLVMLRVTVIVVEFTTVKVPAAALTPVPGPVNAVAPVKFAPVMVTGTASVPDAGCVAELGLIDVSVAP